MRGTGQKLYFWATVTVVLRAPSRFFLRGFPFSGQTKTNVCFRCCDRVSQKGATGNFCFDFCKKKKMTIFSYQMKKKRSKKQTMQPPDWPYSRPPAIPNTVFFLGWPHFVRLAPPSMVWYQDVQNISRGVSRERCLYWARPTRDEVDLLTV